MKVREAMTENVAYIHSSTTLEQAAMKMQELDTGFLPIGDSPDGKLKGVVTDRDLALRAIGDNLDPATSTVDEIKTERVLYCFAGDDLESAAQSMQDQQVYRLIVLDDEENKHLAGIISLGDIVRHGQQDLAARTAQGIAS